MNFFEKLYIKISVFCFEMFALLKIVITSICYKNKIYLFGIPIHGNLGDQAILLAEEKFLKDNFKDMKIIEIESAFILKHVKLLQRIVGNSIILIHGGGFLGTLWPAEEEMFRTTLKAFPNNHIIVFPQTIYFAEETKEEKDMLDESKKSYYAHKNLYICCREKYSYNFMKEKLPNCNIILIPDMVLYLNNIVEEKTLKENILFCIRQDREKIEYDFERIKLILSKLNMPKIDYTDTVINRNIYSYRKRIKILKNKFRQFSSYKLIVTDRLHGMVFALITNTPCLVFENKSYKIKGVYEWIENINYVKLCAETSDMEKMIKELLEQKDMQYENESLIKKYQPLVELIKNHINNKEKGM